MVITKKTVIPTQKSRMKYECYSIYKRLVLNDPLIRVMTIKSLQTCSGIISKISVAGFQVENFHAIISLEHKLTSDIPFMALRLLAIQIT